MAKDNYVNIREIICKHFIGARLIDISQQDEDEFRETPESFVQLMFDNGNYLKFPIGDNGFVVSCPQCPGDLDPIDLSPSFPQ